jgi:DNA-binding transcriptional ArsR family regulator
VNQAYEQALALLAEAVRGTGTVTADGAERVRLTFDNGPTVWFDLAFPADAPTELLETSPATLWVLKRPRRPEIQDLRANHQSFVALSGIVRIDIPGVLLDRTDLEPPPQATGSSSRSAFSDRASSIARWFFGHPVDSEWTVTSLAEHAGVSPSVALYAVRDLEARGLVSTRSEGRKRLIRLLDHERLIEAWARQYDWRANASLTVLAPIGSSSRFLHRLKTLSLPKFAVTLHAGASLIAPHAVVEHIHVYLDARSHARLVDVARECDWQPDPKGALHLLIPKYKRSIWGGVRMLDEIPVVSDIQLILDLWNHPLRGREQAELLLDKHVRELSSHDE